MAAEKLRADTGQRNAFVGHFDVGNLKFVVAVLVESPRGAVVVGVVDLIAVACEVEADEEAFARQGLNVGDAQMQAAALPGGEVGVHGVGIDGIAQGGIYLVVADEVVGIAEIEVVVEHVVLTTRRVGVLGDIEVLIDFLHLVGMGMGAAVASHDAVGAEGIVVLHTGEDAEVTARSIPGRVLLIVERILNLLPVHREALVHPVPDEAALQLGVFVDSVPVVL